MDSQNTNFCFPMKDLENEVVKVIPFDATKHAAAFFEATHPHPELWQYMSIGPFATVAEFIETFLNPVQSSPDQICLAIINKQAAPSPHHPDGQLAGLVTCTGASVAHRTVDLNYTIIFPAFSRQGIPTNASGLLVHYFLRSPAEGGLGLLRVQSRASAGNIASIVAMLRYGFRKEGISRWHRVLHHATQRMKVGNGRLVPGYADRDSVARDTVHLAFCWDDWQNGGREKAERVMERAARSSLLKSKL
ncbi:hypothetical protein P170DRAFT_354701 [Aspergillus steynii IBT 23096]|uniref:N-acetyltransferase domain-containing protein n=1 Tax=Aspergillus steynii IBT 23096 TaxID=1392250 RepID=A0A2I2GAT4_9EURO|nr:uncharacterized protein P170DRAFT_354701 [Aspergillus steynii IBT 23096]PLB49977.1 hypothetical protein P170DRAFT_354701 [Aspergillus steynii IBT 23096]